MKKLLFIGFCALGLSFQAHAAEPKVTKNKPVTKKIKKAAIKPPCTATVTENWSTQYYCSYTGITSHASGTVTGTGTDNYNCTNAYYIAKNWADAASSTAIAVAMVQLQSTCQPPE